MGTGVAVKIFAWHVHGSWMTAFVQGQHTYYVPVLPDRGPDGRGRARTWDWPANVVEVTPEQAADLDVDVAVLQRPDELRLVERWIARSVREIPTVYVEHDPPHDLRAREHPAASHRGVTVVHVTHYNALLWDTGRAPSTVIEHGVVDPGHRYTGELAAAAAVINEPERRTWVAGTDLVLACRQRHAVDLFGMGSEGLGGADVDQATLHGELARRQVYLHPFRWTSLGLSLVEAMHLGMPVAVLASTEAPRAVDPSMGVLTTSASELVDGVGRLLALDPDERTEIGRRSRARALDRYGLDRFLAAWDELLVRVA